METKNESKRKMILIVFSLVSLILLQGCSNKKQGYSNNEKEWKPITIKLNGTLQDKERYEGVGRLVSYEEFETDEDTFSLNFYPGTIFIEENKSTPVKYFERPVLICSGSKYYLEGILLNKSIEEITKNDSSYNSKKALIKIVEYLWTQFSVNDSIKSDSIAKARDVYTLDEQKVRYIERCEKLLVEKSKEIIIATKLINVNDKTKQ